MFCFRPLWLSPNQVMVVPVGPTCEEYAQKVNPDHSYYGPHSRSKNKNKSYIELIKVLAKNKELRPMGQSHDQIIIWDVIKLYLARSPSSLLGN